jgi:aspartyl-tRNA synthetase
MDYSEALIDYGNDKPDLRFRYKLVDVTEEAEKSNYNVIKRTIENGGKVKAIAFAAGFGSKDSKITKDYMLSTVEIAKNLGLKGLTWLYVSNKELKSYPESIAESFESVKKELLAKTGAKNGDVIIIGADASENVLLAALSKLRRIIGIKIGKFEKEHAFLWVDRFPLYEKDEVTGKLQPAHNPFVAPTEETIKYLDNAPEKVLGKRYDLVLNGIEVAGGSMRIHDPELQRKVLKNMGLSDKEIENSLGFLIDGLSYGAPIHGGAAIGLDRFVAVLAGDDDIKEFILFPRNRKFESPLDNSPSSINPKRLKDDYNLKVEK